LPISACVKYWYLLRSDSGISTYSIFGSIPSAAKTALARSFHDRARPVPQLNSPEARAFSPQNSVAATASRTYTKSRTCSPSRQSDRYDLNSFTAPVSRIWW